MTAREVELSGGAPWGFRMHGGVDQNQPLRISRVNPGRKASLSGIREGDVISSINGRNTKSMSNADAHAMLRAAGPVLRLGLNEDRDMSPRKRSIGKASELKRPSQLISESQKATPQAPVYATIRPAQSPYHRPSSSPLRTSLNSLPAALNSTPLVKSVTTSEEPIRFHPTNPFYTTLPSNYTSASKLPVPNGRASFSSVDRNKSKEPTYNDYDSDLKSPSYFTTIYDSGPSSLPYFHSDIGNRNGYESGASKSTANDSNNTFTCSQFENQGLPKEISIKNPFESKRNSDPFEKYLRPGSHVNEKNEYNANISSSLSDNNFTRKEIKDCSKITEHKISEMEEVKTIRKIILNGTHDGSAPQTDQSANSISPTKSSKFDRFNLNSERNKFNEKTYFNRPGNERSETPTQRPQHYFSSLFDHKEDYSSASKTHRSPDNCPRSSAAATTNDPAATNPTVKSPSAAPAPVPSPTAKREYTTEQ